jgi:hypothetical protein
MLPSCIEHISVLYALVEKVVTSSLSSYHDQNNNIGVDIQ